MQCAQTLAHCRLSLREACQIRISLQNAASKRHTVDLLCNAVTSRLYEWSYQPMNDKLLSISDVSFEDCSSSQAILDKIQSCCSEGSSLSPNAVQSLLQHLPASRVSTDVTTLQAAMLLPSIVRWDACSQIPQPWITATLASPLSPARMTSQLSSHQFSETVWAVSELLDPSHCGTGTQASSWASQVLTAATPLLPDFFGPDLAALIYACGQLYKDPILWMTKQDTTAPADQHDSNGKLSVDLSHHSNKASASLGTSEGMASSTPSNFDTAGKDVSVTGAVRPVVNVDKGEWRTALAAESKFQLIEFTADFKPMDISNLLLGLADLSVPIDADLHTAIRKAVFSKTGTIEEKAAMDFALARLETGDKSLHFDPRWTHEELNWLPRRERDKRRIIKENWKRSQWGGY
ncbi:hypothetical protein CEUSTIGMA_g3345.t1 [Chlamydomonas eustigma]|uniref:Uncharacterized protein n=1 Tax=Chlamydomonas eustigma TaxID=1157962 RepID=A0A250WZ59_9CHLO|nr:hypothetical protein CEUSTIGMA_g3345.t1 [Chlamydomonas eustigma]|eukprot:GAX75902.1 hypothetical protein CEUSTIGMA_g3345.t1 [Chlamydomonas eustigma]